MMAPIDMISYMKLRGDLSFWQSPFNDVDAMILTQLSSIDYTGIVPGAKTVDELVFLKWKERLPVSDVARLYKLRTGRQQALTDKQRAREKEKNLFSEQEDTLEFQKKEQLLFLVGESRRFKGLRADGFVRDTSMEQEKQFSAVTFFFSPFSALSAFRGTDGSFISWKENFTMSYRTPIPAQADAVSYIQKLPALPLVRLMLGGHSKGGNMALYAAIYCGEKAQRRIKRVFCYDAPGFLQDVTEKPEYINIKERIRAYVPKSSVIGTVMHVPYAAKVVDSTAVGIRQHGLFTWQVGPDGFALCAQRDAFSRSMQTTINDWLDKIPAEEKQDAVKEVFEILQKNGIMTMDDMMHLDLRRMVGLFRSATRMNARNRDHFIEIIKRIREESKKAEKTNNQR